MTNSIARSGSRGVVLAAVTVLLFTLSVPASGQSPDLSFSKAFEPSTIAPGGISTLTFQIQSSASTPATGIAFTDPFPAGVTIAEPSGLSSNCGVGATLTGPVGGATLILSGATLAPGASCEVRVNVTAGAAGFYANVTSDLTWDQGSAPAASADLTVAADRPTFSKSFAPDNIVIGKTSTLTFTIENLSSGNVFNGSFTDFLPGGLAVASPANIATDCTGSLIAEPGGSSIQLFSGFFPPGNLCTIAVDVRADDAAGARDNLTSDFTSTAGSSGKAGDVLEVRIDPLIKRFSDDPAPPGETAMLEFEIRNLDRFDALTGITFTDDLDATLSGLVAVGTPINDVCGPGSQLSGTSTLTLSGGSIPPSGQCSFGVPVQVPAGAAPGIYPNTTSAMSGSLGGTPQTFDPASDDLAVADFVRLEKTFIPSAIGAGGDVDLEFTLSNTSATNAASNIAFTDGLGSFLNGATPTNLPLNACGGTLQFVGSPEPSLFFSNGSLAAGEDCTFTAILNIPAGTPGGQYPNTTGDVTAVLDGVERVGPGASDTLTVLGAPAPTKTFIDDPADPGGTTTLEFTLSHDEFAIADATDIGFSDDLNATLTGLAAVGTPLSDVCGAGSQLSGTGTLALTGGTLAPGETCVFSVTLQVPAGATPGVYPNVTGAVTATVAGEPTTGRTASDDLLVSGLEADKTFVDSPAVPGDTTTLEFTLTNDNPVLAATAISFSDDLDATLPGLAPLGLPLNDVCGAGSQLIGSGGSLFLAGGSLGPAGSCTFNVTLQVPAATPSGVYSNTTSDIQATYDGSVGLFPPATDSLEVNGELIELSKAFIDDPVAPGAAVTLEFTLANASASDAITNIAFTDDLDAVLPGLVSTSGIQNDVCGAGSQLSGTSVLTLTGASLPAGGSCTFSATLSVPASVPTATDFINTTSSASGELNGLQVSGLPATDALLVNLVGFSKSFDGPGTATGTAVLSFTLDNQGSGPVSGLAFTDDLGAVLPGLVAAGLPQSGICGAGSQISGSSLLAFSGGELAAGDSCSFQVQLAIPAGALPGTFLNTTSDLFSAGLPIAAPASDSLDIEPPPAFTKAFVPVTIPSDAVSTLSFDIDNGASTLAAGDLAFTDPLPAGTQVANPPNAASTCGGTLSAAAGSGSIALSGGSVAAGASCSISVDVSAASEGVYDNVSGDLTSSSGNSGPASATLEVVGADFTVAKAFASQPVLPGGLVDLELTITNDSQFALEDIALSDDLGAVLAGLAAEGLPLNDACGAGSQVSGTSVIALANGSVPANDQCTIVVSVRVPGDATAGNFLNTTSTATGTRQGVDVEAPAASAELVVDVLQFSKSVTPPEAAAGTSIDISFEFTNPDPVNTAEGLSFSDDLDAFVPGMASADTPQSGICGAGSLIDGTSVLSFTGGSVPPSGACSFTVSADVPADVQAGDYTNVTSAVSGNVGGQTFESASASAPLGVQVAPAFAKDFEPAQLADGQSSTLTFTIDNSANALPADDLAFVDPLPPGMQVAESPNAVNTCGGTLTAAAGSNAIELAGGSVAAGGSCTISVDVISAVGGSLTNVTNDLTSSLGNSGPATATLIQYVSVPVTQGRWLAILLLLLAAIGLIHIRRT
ncbi:MAG: hypothetical protein GVY32_01215 [Gammaproteobacteria bacterium]|jgi:uncharacterized repeat protein (TIGR01451 family)|nr:hypothetical protein [Gammaproteobacteria bacterium]